MLHRAAARVGARPGWRIVVIGAVAEEGDSHGAYGVLDEYRPGMRHHRRAQRLGSRHPGLQGQRLVPLLVQKPMAHTASKFDSACETRWLFGTA